MKRILVVDDDQAILNVVTMVLQSEGYEVITLIDGHNLLNQVISIKPDLILLDIALGLLDGRDLCNELNANENTLSLPVILFSAINGHFVTEELECSPNDFIAKPFDVEDLKQRILAQL